MKNNDSVYQQSSSVEGKRNNQARRESFLYNNQEMVKEEKWGILKKNPETIESRGPFSYWQY